MKNLSIILACVLIALMSCTKSKEAHPEIGDGNDEIITVGTTGVHVKYARTDHAELNRVVFHYCPADANGNAQQFEAAEMTKKETFFELTLDDLLSDTLYWYYYELFPNGGNAFTTNQKTFHTQAFEQPEPPTPPTPPSGVPEGAINGLFTINENGDKVYFSQGNLQYRASTNTWRFAEHQWNYVGTQTPGWLSQGICGGNVEGSDNNNVSENYDGWIDLFNWGTSGYDHGANYYHPWNIGGNIGDYYAYGCNSCSLFDYDGKADWGYNAISNGGNAENLWRTLTVEEWDYILYDRSVDSEIRFAKAIVNGVNGLIILPDGWQSYIYSLNHVNQTDLNYDQNIVAESIWSETLQYNGAVFLPAAGFRQRLDNDIDDTSICGRYWSSTLHSNTKAYTTDFGTDWMYTGGVEFWFSRSVRLVQNAN